MANRAGITAHEEAGRVRLVATGPWCVATAAGLDARLRVLAPLGPRVAIDMTGVERLDSAGAWLLHRTRTRLAEAGVPVDLEGVRPEHAGLLQRVVDVDKPMEMVAPRSLAVVDLVRHVGQATVTVLTEARALLGFFGLTVTIALRTLMRPGRLRFTSLINHMEQVGLNAMPIVGLLSFLIGVVLAYQGADQLRRFGAELFTVNLLGVSILRELGILITAIIIAGRSGSAFTAQIGTMKVNQEIDAMEALGLDPVEILVLPRAFALILTLPLIAFFADLMGLIGGALMSLFVLDISLGQFLRQLHESVTTTTFFVGLVKAPVFAFIIALVGCYCGLKVAGNAESVGRMTTQSVVESIFLVIVADAAFSILFSYLDL
ncbi:MAG: MlaE family lipid ABC transporter permease subunit [Alphaproteobacteria bacterium]|nr:MlaE family lipid ABC transporter permease subunit [Alphaproteobacteria bacterium]